jgi:hypothetical protein
MRIAAVGSALPDHYYTQETLTRWLQEVWRDDPALGRRLASLHARVDGATVATAADARRLLGARTPPRYVVFERDAVARGVLLPDAR